MLVLFSVLLLSSHVLPLVQSLTCNEKEYLHNDQCCKKCEPGQFIHQKCEKGSDTLCRTCGDGFFMDVDNENFRWCDECTMCTKEHMKYEKNCTAKSNAVCTCEEGYRCSDSQCEMCVKVQTTTTSTSTKKAPHTQGMKYEKNCTPNSNAVCTCDEGYRCSDSKCKMCVKVQTTTTSPPPARPASTKTVTHTQDMHDHVDGSCQHQPVFGTPKRATLDPVSAHRKRKYQCQCRRCVERQRNWRMSEKGGGRRPLMRLRIEYLPAAAIYLREE